MFDSDAFKKKRGFIQPYTNDQDTVVIIRNADRDHPNADKYEYYLSRTSAQELLDSESVQKAERKDSFFWWVRYMLILLLWSALVGFTVMVFVMGLIEGQGIGRSIGYALAGGFTASWLLVILLSPIWLWLFWSVKTPHHFVHRVLQKKKGALRINGHRDFPFTSSVPAANTAMNKTVNGITPENRDWVFQQRNPSHAKTSLCQQIDQFTYGRVSHKTSEPTPFDETNPPESLMKIRPDEAGWIQGAVNMQSLASNKNS